MIELYGASARMKRVCVVLILLAVFAAFAAIPPGPPGGRTTYLVLASDAPSWMRRQGPNVWLCDGTNDEVEVQAAVDAAHDTDGDGTAEAGEGGIVQLSSGNFSWSKPSGALIVDGDSCTLTAGSGQCVASSLVFDNGTIANVAVGQLYRLSGGNDGEGNTLEVNIEEFIATVIAVDATTVTLSENVDEDYTGVDFDLLVACVIHRPGVTIRGSGRTATYIKLAAGQDCDLLHVEPGSTEIYWQLEDLTMVGNKGNQTVAGISNGIVLNTYALDYHVSGLELISCKGDGFTANCSWGLHIVGGWIEYMDGVGLVLGDSGDPTIIGTKITANLNDAIRMRAGASNMITNCVLGVTNGGTGYGIRMSHGSNANIVTGNDIGGEAGGILLSGVGHRIVNNAIASDAGTAGVDVANTYDNLISGNRFSTGLTPAIDADESNNGASNIHSNAGADWTKEFRHVWAENGSGGTIVTRTLVVHSTGGDGDEFTTSTTKGDSAVWGCTVVGNISDDASGRIQTLGYQKWFPVEGNITFAVGDELCVSDGNAGAAEIAVSGNTVIAICLQARGAGADEVYRGIAAVLVKPYTKQ